METLKLWQGVLVTEEQFISLNDHENLFCFLLVKPTQKCWFLKKRKKKSSVHFEMPQTLRSWLISSPSTTHKQSVKKLFENYKVKLREYKCTFLNLGMFSNLPIQAEFSSFNLYPLGQFQCCRAERLAKPILKTTGKKATRKRNIILKDFLSCH